MAKFSSTQVTISAGPAPGRVVVRVHGSLDAKGAATLQRVLDQILEDREITTVRIDLCNVRAVNADGIAGLIAAAERADQRGAELSLDDPSELLGAAPESAGLLPPVAIVHQDRRSPWLATEGDRRRARSNHPSTHLLVLEGTNEWKASPSFQQTPQPLGQEI
ncbi:MAG: STAS domain-containing protein [Actinomycetota bacterium]|nr:STAS domain-containing protein [Actinomycetota bacterium]